jgi:hypothetical protein
LAEDDDIAIYGRNKSDIILTDDDVRIRCGSRLKTSSTKSGIAFNRTDPAFLHLKHTDSKRGNGSEDEKFRSTATIVADRINLIGNQSKEPFKTNNRSEMITDEEMNKIVEKAHQLPYGDILVEFLKLFVNAFSTHVHPYPGLPPCKTNEVVNTETYNLSKMLSESVRIN